MRSDSAFPSCTNCAAALGGERRNHTAFWLLPRRETSWPSNGCKPWWTRLTVLRSPKSTCGCAVQAGFWHSPMGHPDLPDRQPDPRSGDSGVGEAGSLELCRAPFVSPGIGSVCRLLAGRSQDSQALLKAFQASPYFDVVKAVNNYHALVKGHRCRPMQARDRDSLELLRAS